MRIGIDLGGTKIEGIALADDGRELGRHRVPTPRDDYPATLAAVAGMVRRLESEIGEPATVGLGMPGSLSPTTGRVRNANSVWLIGQPIDRDLAAELGREVRCANDANCLAVSEATDGAGAGARVVFAVILGTGVGAGITVDGALVAGRNGVAGEWGHNPLPWATGEEVPGPHCYCGRRGCLETWLSGPALARDHARATGQQLAAPAIAEAAEAGDRAADATLDRYVNRLARGLAHVAHVCDPDVFVLAGGVSNIRRLYEQAPALLPQWTFGGEADTPIEQAVHGDSSGVRGAAGLWPAADMG
ncbi:MAG: ROK family protein [Egibacteraceae bacterium]